MVIRQALPFDFAPRGRRAPARTTLIVTGSLAVHMAVAAYLAMMQFAPPKPATSIDEKPIDLEFYERPKPPPPPPKNPTTKPPPKQTVKFNQVVTTDNPPTDVPPIQAEPAEKPPESFGPIALNTQTITRPSPPDPIIRNPTWLKRPGASEFARFYPDREMRMGTEGRAMLNCTVTARGSVNGCTVASLTPANSGFGEAAIKLSRYFVMSPRTVDGQPVEGGQVSIPITFNLK